MLGAGTPITIVVPKFVAWIFSAGVVVALFIAGYQWHKLKEVCGEMPKMRRALDIISGLLLGHEWTTNHVYVSTSSPLKLTPEGKKMLEESGFEEFFRANKDKLFSDIAAAKPESEAEVEGAVKALMLYLDTRNTPKMELLENYCYNKAVAAGNVLFAYSIEIKDRYLKEHPLKEQPI